MSLQAILVLISLSSVFGAHLYPPITPYCEPFTSNFNLPSSVSDSGPFVAISPAGSYRTEDGILELFLQKPPGEVTREGRVNDKLGNGATINSTFTLLYGKVSFTVAAPVYSGVVAAVILIGDQLDEIDIELLGGDEKHWQTNVFAPSRRDPKRHYGVFSAIDKVPASSDESPTIEDYHTYSIDWNKERIIWSIDGKTMRTLSAESTLIDGYPHYPIYPTRLQLGIWDASSPVGTSIWAKGPIDWSRAPEVMTAFVKSVTVECPYS